MRSNVLVVTGTDTGVGKTFITCALAHALRARGQRVAVCKPVETGVIGEPADALALKAAAVDPAPLDAICPYRLRAPLAPAVAATLEGITIDPERLVDVVTRRARTAQVLLIEGAGGLLVPLAGTVTFLDLVARIDAALVIVGANRLGTINHCALTARAATAAGIRVAGFVLSQPTLATDPSVATNAAAVSELTGLPCLGVVPHLRTPEEAASLLRLPVADAAASPAHS